MYVLSNILPIVPLEFEGFKAVYDCILTPGAAMNVILEDKSILTHNFLLVQFIVSTKAASQ